MSSKFSKVIKSLAGAKVVSANDVWTGKSNNNLKLNKTFNYIGKIDTEFPNIIIKAKNKKTKIEYMKDTNNLPKRTKQELLNHFYDKQGKRNKNKVAYIIRTDKESANQKFNQLKLGLILKTRFKNYEVPTGVHNEYYSKDVNGNKLKLKDNDNIVEIEKAHLSKKQALLIKDFAKNKRK